MRIRYFISAVIFLAMLALQCCDKHELTELEKLPPLTTTGKGTFGCLVDGKAWVIESIPDAQAYYQTGTLFISARLTRGNKQVDIALFINDLNLKEGEYTLYQSLSQSYSNGAVYDDLETNCEYETSSIYTGTLTITHLDKVNFIISGTFDFVAHGTNCSKTVKITEGRFDIHYAP